MSIAVIIAASGTGSRMQSRIPKQFLKLSGKSILARTVELFLSITGIAEIILVVPSGYVQNFKRSIKPASALPAVRIVAGGKRRVDSVRAGLSAVSKTIELVVIHDGVRPLALPQDIMRCIDAGRKWGAAIAAVPCTDTIKRATKTGYVQRTIDRSSLWLVQTPQVFKKRILAQAFSSKKTADITDDSQLVEHTGAKVKIVPVGRYNIKITCPEDVRYAESVLKARN